VLLVVLVSPVGCQARNTKQIWRTVLAFASPIIGNCFILHVVLFHSRTLNIVYIIILLPSKAMENKTGRVLSNLCYSYFGAACVPSGSSFSFSCLPSPLLIGSKLLAHAFICRFFQLGSFVGWFTRLLLSAFLFNYCMQKLYYCFCIAEKIHVWSVSLVGGLWCRMLVSGLAPTKKPLPTTLLLVRHPMWDSLPTAEIRSPKILWTQGPLLGAHRLQCFSSSFAADRRD